MGFASGSEKVYDRSYGGLRGIDFSSDPTQVDERRLSYAVNMYRDYKSEQGQALETVAGYRRRFVAPDEIVNGTNVNKIYGIHEFDHKKTDGTVENIVLVHAGSKLWKWANYPKSVNVNNYGTLTVPAPTSTVEGISTFDFTNLSITVGAIVSITAKDGTELSGVATLTNGNIQLISSTLQEGDILNITYQEGVLTSSSTPLKTGMNKATSTSFVFDNTLFILDGKAYLRYDGTTIANVNSNAYTPTTFINKIQSGDNANDGTLFEQRNSVSSDFKQTFIADGTTTKFYLNKEYLQYQIWISFPTLYGQTLQNTNSGYPDYLAYTVNDQKGYIEFPTAPVIPQNVIKNAYITKGYETKFIDDRAETYSFVIESYTGKEIFALIEATDANRAYEGKTITINDGMDETWTVSSVEFYDEQYAGIEITARTVNIEIDNLDSILLWNSRYITDKCTLACLFDNRVFLSGNPDYPNAIFYSLRNSDGKIDPTYFGVYSFLKVGSDKSPIKGMVQVADTLMVLKGDSQQESPYYFLSGKDTSDNINPRVYTVSQGLGGIGCLGACVNFLDDPIFISRLGVEAVGQLSVRLERAIEHRSSLIDAKLTNLDLSKATLAEWNGYLVVLIEGKIFLADSRQAFTHSTGTAQYEWYYLEDIGVYQGQFTEYKYAKTLPEVLAGETIEYSGTNYPIEIVSAEYQGTTANELQADGTDTAVFAEDYVLVTYDEISTYAKIVCKIDTTNSKAYLCEGEGNKIGGVYKPAILLKTLDDNLFFGTQNGVVCSFNFDMHDEYGEIPTKYYTFDDRTIISGCATLLDNCGIRNYTKSTIKHSVVLKTKSFSKSVVKVKIRTNSKQYTGTETSKMGYVTDRVNNSVFAFDNIDFSDLTFNTSEQTLFAIKEQEKNWVEKQYYVYSNEYMKPFGVYYIAYRFKVAGRLKG